MTYQTVALATVDHPIQDIQNLEPELQHAVLVRELIKIAQEDLADQNSCLNAGFAHSDRI